MNKQTYVGVGDWVIDTGAQLGGGSFGNVYVCHRADNENVKYAAKKIPLSGNQKDTDKINTELRIFSKVNSPYVVKMHSFKKTQNSVYIFMDLCNEGALSGYIQKGGKMDVSKALDFFQKLIQGYYALREQKVLHRDLKPDNVLIDNGVPKLTDFGLGRIFEDFQELSGNQTKSLVGSEYYMAPELLEYVKIAFKEGKLTERPHYTDKCDVWSMGMIFYYMLVGQIAWKYEVNTEGYLNNIKSKPLQIQNTWPPLVQHLLTRMLHVDANQRFSWEEVFQHPLISGNQQQVNENQLYGEIQQYMGQYPSQNQIPLQQYQFQGNYANNFGNNAPQQQVSGNPGQLQKKLGDSGDEMENEDDM